MTLSKINLKNQNGEHKNGHTLRPMQINQMQGSFWLMGLDVSPVKKKFLMCDIHGLTLFRCRRRCWQRRGKDKIWYSEYTERCFKCVSEGRYIKIETKKEKIKHFKI